MYTIITIIFSGLECIHLRESSKLALNKNKHARASYKTIQNTKHCNPHDIQLSDSLCE